MTLNITLASRWLTVQSSDFWLTHDGGIEPDSKTAQKQVVLQYFGWSGLLCYTGVATYGSHDTARWLEQELVHEGQRSPQEVADRIQKKGSAWLKKIPDKHRFHTFTMVTYQDKVARVYLISTYEQLGHDPLAEPARTLQVSQARARKPTCVVTGQSCAVTPWQQDELKQMLAANPPPDDLRKAVAYASREASSRADDKVGKECVVAHLLPNGSGGAEVYGNLENVFIPLMITNGLNPSASLPSVLTDKGMGPSRLVGANWTSTGEHAALVGVYRELSKQTGSGWPDENHGGYGVGPKIVFEHER